MVSILRVLRNLAGHGSRSSPFCYVLRQVKFPLSFLQSNSEPFHVRRWPQRPRQVLLLQTRFQALEKALDKNRKSQIKNESSMPTGENLQILECWHRLYIIFRCDVISISFFISFFIHWISDILWFFFLSSRVQMIHKISQDQCAPSASASSASASLSSNGIRPTIPKSMKPTRPSFQHVM